MPKGKSSFSPRSVEMFVSSSMPHKKSAVVLSGLFLFVLGITLLTWGEQCDSAANNGSNGFPKSALDACDANPTQMYQAGLAFITMAVVLLGVSVFM